MCSTVVYGNNAQKYLAENYDFTQDHGLVAVNLKGTQKENGRQPGEKALSWSVKYGSITFNQFSLELPVSGMNERGLAVALMWHDEGDVGLDGTYSRLSELQWIQYQLDNFQNIAEVVQGLDTIRPKPEMMPLHYTLLDAGGNSLIVEFIDGQPHLQQNPEFPILTNSSYQPCLKSAQSNLTDQDEHNNSSVARFERLYSLLQNHKPDEMNAFTGFDWLQSVSQTPQDKESFPWDKEEQRTTITAWSIVFNPSEKVIYLKTHQNQAIREIRLNDFNYEKEAEYLLMDINDGIDGSATHFFEPYSVEQNRRIIKKSAEVFPMPASEQEGLVHVVDMLYKSREMKLGQY